MLRKQLETWAEYDVATRAQFRFIVVDDGSPEPAEPIVRQFDGVALYRIHEDIPWNRAGARNLGATVCDTDWLMHVDTDHVLPASSAAALIATKVDPKRWYRFSRFRVGKADETRRKDAIGPGCEFGPIKPHIDSYLCTKALYWSVGGYDEDYSGVLGGGVPFLALLEKTAPVEVLPACLHVYTRHAIPDSSISTLSRDTSRYASMRKQKGLAMARNPLRFDWSRVL